MRFSLATLLLILFSASTFAADHAHKKSDDPGLVTVKSQHSVTMTADKLETLLTSKGMTIFNRIDHGAGAEGAGVELRPTELVIFGNPKVGSPLMVCAQSVAIDLPQKMLIWEDAKGDVWLGYNDPEYLEARHSIDESCEPILKKIAGALSNFAMGAAK